MAVALSMFGVHARGPLVDSYVIQLEQECEKFWKTGRQMCEVLSLRGNPCTQPLHKGGSGEPSVHEIDNKYANYLFCSDITCYYLMSKLNSVKHNLYIINLYFYTHTKQDMILFMKMKIIFSFVT